MVPTAAAQSEEDVKRAEAAREDAYRRLVAVQQDVEEAVTAYEDIRDEIFEVEYQLERLDTRISQDRDEVATLEESTRQLLVQAYVNRTPSTVGIALEAASIQDLVARQSLLDRANTLSFTSIDRLEVVSRELDRLTDQFEVDRTRLQDLEAEAELALAQLTVVLDRAQEEFGRRDAAAREAQRLWEAELARRRAAEERRRRAAAASSGGSNGTAVGGLVCPQAQPRFFRDTWGAPRSGGRRHQGTDIFGAKGNRVFAVTSGSIRTGSGGLGGISIWLNGDDGNSYYYAHLSGYADGIGSGTHVAQGSVIGFVGNTGNARGGSHHTHFEIHPGGGSAVNPYWTLSRIC